MGCFLDFFVDLMKKIVNPTMLVKRKHIHEGSRHFQDKWATQLPWAKFATYTKGNVQ